MKLRTAIVLAGLGVLAARKAASMRERPMLLLEAGPPPLAPAPSVEPEPEAVVEEPHAQEAEAPVSPQGAPGSGNGSWPPAPGAAGTDVEAEARSAGAEIETEIETEPEPETETEQDAATDEAALAPHEEPAPAAFPPAGLAVDADPGGVTFEGWPVPASFETPRDDVTVDGDPDDVEPPPVDVALEPAASPPSPADEEPAVEPAKEFEASSEEHPVTDEDGGAATTVLLAEARIVTDDLGVVPEEPVTEPEAVHEAGHEEPGPRSSDAPPWPEPVREIALPPEARMEISPGPGPEPDDGPWEASSASSGPRLPVASAFEGVQPIGEAAARGPSLPAVEDVPTGWSVVLYPGGAGSEVGARAEGPSPPVAAPAEPAAGARHFLLRNQVPVVFMGATPLAMLGLDRVVGRLGAITYQDCFDGRHGSVYVPRGLPTRAFGGLAEVANALLSLPDVVDRLRLRPGKIVTLAADEETERLAAGFGHVVALAPAVLRRRLAAPSELVHLAREAGVHALPAVTGHAASYQDLLLLARGLGTDLLVESLDRPTGVAVAIGSLEDWAAHERRLGAEHLRVTRRLDGSAFTIVAVATGHGTVVAPTIVTMRRFPELPPYGAGIAVSDVAASLEEGVRLELRRAAGAIGDRLAREDFTGIFEVDLTLDRRGGGMTLTAIRPEGSLALALDAVSAVGADELPMLAVHVAVQLGGEIPGESVRDDVRADGWSLFVLSDTMEALETVTETPGSGVWQLDPSAHGGIRYVRSETDWRSLSGEQEAFYLRIQRAGSIRYPGAEVGVIVMRGTLTGEDGQLTERMTQWVRGVRKNVWTGPAHVDEPSPGETPPGVVIF